MKILHLSVNSNLKMYVSLFIIQVLKLERLFVVTDSCIGREEMHQKNHYKINS